MALIIPHAPQQLTATRITALTALLLTACGVSAQTTDTGGVDVKPNDRGHGVVVVQSDYQSTNVSLVDWYGHVLSSSLLSSASSDPGLSTPLSGDVVASGSTRARNEIVLIDRFMTSVLTWVALDSGRVSRQLSVSTGFASNPHDYLPLSEHKAYVSRYGDNPNAGSQPFDQGSDVLVIDPSQPAITASLDLRPAMKGENSRFLPRPDRMLLAQGKVWVLLAGYTRDFMASADGRLVALDPQTDELGQVLVLEGLHGCAGLAASPDGNELVVTCSGEFGGDSKATADSSGLVRVGIGQDGTATELGRYEASRIAENQTLGFGVTYSDDNHVLVTVFGNEASDDDPKRGDRVVSISLSDGNTSTLHESTEPFVLGDVRCGGTSDAVVCYGTDAEVGVLRWWSVEKGGVLQEREPFRVDTTVGLPPRQLGGW